MVRNCPHTDCRFHRGRHRRFFTKKGYYTTRYNHQPVPRYRCRGCRKTFSSHTFRDTYGQKKPHLNAQIHRLYCSAVTQRRMARILGVNRKTVVRKFLFLALKARKVHQEVLKGRRWDHAQFDEMESFEHTRLKPLSIALAVAEDGSLIAAKVACMPYKGPLAKVARHKYGVREDKRPKAREEVLKAVRNISTSQLVITTDAHPDYAKLIKKVLPHATHRQVVAKKCHPVKRLAQRRRNQCDPLFAINHCAAKIRHDLSRMARRVWTTTKKAHRLQAHLDLYIAFLGGYPLT